MGIATNSRLNPFATFNAAACDALNHLRGQLGLDAWMVIREHGATGVVLCVSENHHGIRTGQVCHRRDGGVVPAPVAGVAVAADPAEAARLAPLLLDRTLLAAYVGAPLRLPDGDHFGSLCAVDTTPMVLDGAGCAVIETTARLLATILSLELQTQQATRRAERIEAEARLDPLTGLYNRRGWDILLAREEARCRRYGSAGAVIVLDLDDLKRVNDGAGHAAGDRMIAAAARCLSQVVRGSDLVARLGGDEFGVLLVETCAPDAEELVARVRSRFALERIAVSVGCAARGPLSTLQAAMAHADEAMYADKRRRKVSQPT